MTITAYFDERFDADWFTPGLYPGKLADLPNLGNPQEVQSYGPEGLTLAAGNGVISATHDPRTASNGRRYPWRSGAITTRGKVEFTYGTVTVRAALPVGRGWWPAVWMLAAIEPGRQPVWPPEIDLVEAWGDPGRVSHNVHWGSSPRRFQSGPGFVDVDPAVFHDYRMVWTPDSIAFAIDGLEVDRVTDSAAIPHRPMYVIANLAVDGAKGGPPSDAVGRLLINRMSIEPYVPDAC